MSEAYERIDDSPRFDGRERELHEMRYRIASAFVEQGDSVLDAGCGTGYGFRLLAKEPIQYLGLDRNPIDDAKFKKVDFEDPNQSYDWLPMFDVFVGLEIIEHLDDKGVEAFVRLARCAGKWIIVSTPIVPNSNPFHKQQFKPENIQALFGSGGWHLYDFLLQDNGRYGIFIYKRQ